MSDKIFDVIYHFIINTIAFAKEKEKKKGPGLITIYRNAIFKSICFSFD
jgi:hypothetical protein